jgi:putative peptide zinc metalloprotease protein
MSEALFSPLWHEVAGLKPALRSDTHSRRLHARGEVWHVLWSEDTRGYLRLNDSAWRMVGLFDGRHRLDTLWQAVWARDGRDAPSQPEVLDMLARLDRAGLLRSDSLPDFAERYDEAAERAGSTRRAALNPLSVRVDLVDPSGWLDRLSPHLRPLFQWSVLLAWLVVVVYTAAMALADLPALAAAFSSALSAPRFVLIAWLVYPLMKALHELAHAAAIHHWGGRVHSAGFTLLVLVPVPFVDAQAASAFTRRQRLLVSAAGVMTELFIAALAWWVWTGVAPGLVRDVALTAVFIGAVSSLAFNGNPLLRFDGYHMFTDALDLPNLASRSRRWWQEAIGRRLFAAPIPGMHTSPGETPWLVGYAPAAALFQLLIGVQIARWLAGFSAILGLAALLALGYALLLAPVARSIRAWRGAASGTARRVTGRRLWLGAALAGVFIAAVPMPAATVAPGVIDLPDDARLRAQSGGLIDQLLVADGARVTAGDPIARLDEPALGARLATLDAQLDALQARRYGALLTDPRDARDLVARIEALGAERDDTRERLAGLTLRAGVDGRVVLPRADDLPGRWLAEGDTLGYVIGDGPLQLRALVPDRLAARVRDSVREVTVHLPGAGEAIPARITRMSAGAQQRLPSPALADSHGGPIAVVADGEQGERAIEAQYELRVALAAPAPAAWIGARGWVRFGHPPEPLLVQWGRGARQLLLRWFSGTGGA